MFLSHSNIGSDTKLISAYVNLTSSLYFIFPGLQKVSSCLGIISQMNVIFLETSCAVMDAVSQEPGSVMGCRTALMKVMKRNAVSILYFE